MRLYHNCDFISHSVTLFLLVPTLYFTIATSYLTISVFFFFFFFHSNCDYVWEWLYIAQLWLDFMILILIIATLSHNCGFVSQNLDLTSHNGTIFHNWNFMSCSVTLYLVILNVQFTMRLYILQLWLCLIIVNVNHTNEISPSCYFMSHNVTLLLLIANAQMQRYISHCG